jgi:hypothetical protein
MTNDSDRPWGPPNPATGATSPTPPLRFDNPILAEARRNGESGAFHAVGKGVDWDALLGHLRATTLPAPQIDQIKAEYRKGLRQWTLNTAVRNPQAAEVKLDVLINNAKAMGNHRAYYNPVRNDVDWDSVLAQLGARGLSNEQVTRIKAAYRAGVHERTAGARPTAPVGIAPAQVAGAMCAAIVVVSAFLPWYEASAILVGSYSISGTDISGVWGGWATAISAGIGGLLFLVDREAGSWLGGAAALVCGAVAIRNLAQYRQMVRDQVLEAGIDVDAAAGLYLTLAGAIGMIIALLVLRTQSA